MIIEEVSQMTYEEYVTNNIFIPLDMKHSAASIEKSKENGLINGYRNYFGFFIAGEPDYPKEIKNGTWTNIPAWYISSSAFDMGKYLQMYLNNGKGLISEESINKIFYDNVLVTDKYSYGLGWGYSASIFDKPTLWHEGLAENYSSNMLIIPEDGIGIVILVNMNDYLVTNNFLGDITSPIINKESQDVPNLYFILHFIIDLLCIFFV